MYLKYAHFCAPLFHIILKGKHLILESHARGFILLTETERHMYDFLLPRRT